jgi:hypothetical protein
MYKIIIGQIKTILEGITAIKSVYAYPLDGTPKTFPSVIFFPDTIENMYSTNEENQKALKFKMWIVVDLAGTNEEQAFTSILPNAVDAVVAEFDSKWSSLIGGRRSWMVIDSGIWGLSEENNSKRAYAELSLTYNFTNSV